MSIKLIVNNNTYDYPTAGEPPGWGEDTTGWAVEVTNALASIGGYNTIFEAQMDIPASQAIATDVPTLIFNQSVVHSAEINYRCFRETTSTSLMETGIISIMYNPATATWLISQHITVGGGTGISFSITPAGQVQYTAATLANYNSGYLRFKTITTLGKV